MAADPQQQAPAESRWDRFWFGEGSLVRLAVFRIVMMLAAFYGVWHFRIGVLQHADGVDLEFMRRSWNPIYAFELLGLGPPGAQAARWVFGVLVAAIVLGALGLFARLACAVVAVLGFYWIGTAYSFGKPHHDCVALMFGLLALPLAPVGARLSVDSLRARLRVARRGGDPLSVPEKAPWAALPLRLTQLTIAVGYFFSGASKLAIAGLDWANGYTLQGIMLEYQSPWTAYFVENVQLCALMSAGLLLVQASFPLIFLSAWLRWFYVPMAVVFHLLAMQTMATGSFITLWFTLVAFVPSERIAGFLRRQVVEAARLRGLLLGLGLAAGLLGVARLYTLHMPPAYLLGLVPLALTAALGTLGRLRLWIDYDPNDAASRRSVALLDALDWSHRIAWRARPGTPQGLGGRTSSGTELDARAVRRAAALRLPIVLSLVLWTALVWFVGNESKSPTR